jgi:hypothetical protein
MFSLARRSTVLASSARLLAATSVTNQTQDRSIASASTKRAVVFNMGGAIVPALAPVIKTEEWDLKMSVADITKKLFAEGDQELRKLFNFNDKNMTMTANIYDVHSACKSLQGEGLKTVLVNDAPGLNPDLIPVDRTLFDSITSSGLNDDFASSLGATPDQVVYLDNDPANLAKAAELGLCTVDVGDGLNLDDTLEKLESHVQVPLKTHLPGFAWTYWNRAHNPYKNMGDNIVFTLFCIFVYIYIAHIVGTKVLKIDLKQHPGHPYAH